MIRKLLLLILLTGCFSPEVFSRVAILHPVTPRAVTGLLVPSGPVKARPNNLKSSKEKARNNALLKKHLTVPSGSGFLPQGPKLVDLAVAGTEFQGWSTAISSDGNTAIVGGYGVNGNIGAGWIYTRTNGAWTMQAKLIGNNVIGSSEQGGSVAISSDGLTAAVGGYNDNGGVGAVWVFTSLGGVWTQQGNKLLATDAVGTSSQGRSVALSADGNTLMVGGSYDNSHLGAAWVYTRNSGTWTQQGNKLVGSGSSGTDVFQGCSVSLSADGNTGLVGAYGDASNIGAAWQFYRTGTTWAQVGTKITPSDETGAGEFGYSVSMCANASTAIVGAMLDNGQIGGAWIFSSVSPGSTFRQSGAKHVGTGIGAATPGICLQGSAVSISTDGSTAAVGGWGDQNYAGAIWIYTGSGGIWTQLGPKIDTAGTSNLGKALALSADGMTIIAGEPNDISGSTYYGASIVFSVPYLTPAVQATNLLFTSTSTVATTASWTNGNGSSRVVFIYKGTLGSTATPLPVNAMSYTANSAYGTGSQLGTTGWYCVYNDIGSSVNVTGLTKGTTYQFMTEEYNGMTGTQKYLTVTAQNNPDSVATLTPTISFTGTLSSLSSYYGSSSSVDSFTVAGNTLSAGITVTAPAGFEVSTSQVTGFSTSLTTGVAGSVSPTKIYIRLIALDKATSTLYTGNVVLTSTGSPTNPGPAISGLMQPRPFEISVPSAGLYYGSYLPAYAAVTVSDPTGINNEYVTGLHLTSTYPAQTGKAAAGTPYIVNPSAATGGGTFLSSNYSITYDTLKAVILKLPLVITASPMTHIYGVPLYTGIGSGAFTTTPMPNSETIGYVTMDYMAGNNITDGVGTYSSVVTISAAAGGNFSSSNYAISYVQNDLTVTKAPLTVTGNTAKVYGTSLVGGSGSFSFTPVGLVPGDTIQTVTIAYAKGAAPGYPVGSYDTTATPTQAIGPKFNLANYLVTYKRGSILIIPKPIIITAVQVTKFYGTLVSSGAGYQAKTAITSVGLQNADSIGTVTLAFGTASGASAAIGTYPGQVTPSAATGGTFLLSNYTPIYLTSNLVIVQEPLTITATAVTKVYGAALTSGGGKAGVTNFTSSGLVNGENIGTVTLTYNAGAAATAPAGVYLKKDSVSAATGGTFASANYLITYVNASITVGVAPLLITPVAISKVYGTLLSRASGSTGYIPSGLMNGELIGSVTVKYGAGALKTDSAGTYDTAVADTLAVGGTFNPINYAITYGATTLTVTPAPLTLTANNVSKVYGTLITSSSGSTAFISSGLLNLDSLASLTIAYGAGAAANAAAGTYTGSILPSGIKGKGTYKAVNYAPVYLTGNIFVSKVPLIITASGVTKLYGSTLISSSGQAGAAAFTASGLLNSETIGSVTLKYALGASPSDGVGTYLNTDSASLATGGTFSPGNYTISYLPGNIVVLPTPLVLTPNAVTKVFGTGLSTTLLATAFTPAGLKNNETVQTVKLKYGTGALPTDIVNTYLTGVSDTLAAGGTFNPANYTISYGAASLIVTPATLTLTASDVSKIYGSTATGGAGSTAYTISGLVNKDSVLSLTTLYGSGAGVTSNVGAYPGSVSALSPLGNASFHLTNYTPLYVNGQLTVIKAALTIAANAITKNYGSLLLGSTGNSVFSSSGLKNGDYIGTITLSLGAGSAATAAVKTYAGSVTPSEAIGGTFLSGNYSITYGTSDIIVMPALLTVSALPGTKVYGTTLLVGAGSSLFTSSGLTNGEGIGSVTLSYSGGEVATASVGTYPLSATVTAATGGSFTASNYTLKYSAADLTVTVAPLSITTGPVSKFYGATLTSLSGVTAFTSTGLKNNEAVGSVTTDFGTGSSALALVGTYLGQSYSSMATGGTFTASNYLISYATASIVVNPQPLTITATGPEKIYGTALKTGISLVNFMYAGVVNGESINGVVMTPDNRGATFNTPAGSNYLVAPSAATGDGTFLISNYSITYVSFPGVVSALPIVITATGPGKTYGTILSPSISTNNFATTAMASGEAVTSVLLNFDAAGQSATIKAGSAYVVTPSTATGNAGFSAANYQVSYVPFNSLVSPAPLVITALPAAKVYGTTLPGSSGSALFAVAGLQNNETVAMVNIAVGAGSTATAAAGIYLGSLSVSLATGGTFLPSNYSVSYMTGALTVTPAPLVITSAILYKSYGAVVSSASGITSFTSSGLQNNETVGSVSSVIGQGGLASAVVGSYTGSSNITDAAGGSFIPANYSIFYVAAPMIVAKATLSILPTDVTKNYGSLITGASSSTAFTASGLQNGETIGSLSVNYGTGSGIAATVGIYPGSIVGSLAAGGSFSLNNYIISYYRGNIIVAPAALLITPAGVNKLYGVLLTGSSGSAAYTATGLQNAETAATITLAYGPGASAAASAGTYPISVTGSQLTGGTFLSSNYSIVYMPAKLVVGTQMPSILVVSQPDCSTALGTFTVQNYNAAFTYTISAPGFTSQAGATFTAPAGTYTMTALAPLSFTSPASFSFTINPRPPIPNLLITNPLEVNAPSVVNIELAAITALSDPNLSFTYFKDINGMVALADPAAIRVTGVYYIKGTNSYGCSSPVKAVFVYIDPAPKLVITNPKAVNDPSTVDITVSAITAGSTPGLSYTYFTDSLGTIPLTDPKNISVPGTYYVKGTNAGGNYLIKKVIVVINYVIFVPNIFTPNGDGKNDRFEIVGLQHFPGSTLMIYNRWGNAIYHSENYQNTWDGGGQIPGTYYYVLLLKKGSESTVYKGWVQILH